MCATLLISVWCADAASDEALVEMSVKYATGFSVRDSADIRLVDVGQHDHFALVRTDDADAPEGYTKVKVPIQRTICMTSLQLSNFTVLEAHDVVKGHGRQFRYRDGAGC